VRSVGLLVGAFAVVGLLGCSDSGSSPRGPSAASGASSAGGTTTSIDVTDPPGGRKESADRAAGFRPSQCFNADGFVAGRTLEPTQLQPIACDAPHRLEVDAVLQHPSPKSIGFPGEDAMAAFADDQCLSQFSDYVGQSYEQSSLDITDIRPTERSWSRGDRTVVCLVYDQDFSDLTASVKGSRR
jgi:hypothetical protein